MSMNTIYNPKMEELLVLGHREESPTVYITVVVTTVALHKKDRAEGLRLLRAARKACLKGRPFTRLLEWERKFTWGNGNDSSTLLEGPAEYRKVVGDGSPH